MGRVVGIDLGTTNSVLAVLEAGKPTVVASAEGMRVTPSVVGFTATGELLVGEMAKRQAVSNPERTFRSFKRRMGSSARYEVDGREFTPQELSSRVLLKLKADAETYLGETVDRAVISVPAYFDDAQRQATLEAGRIAGLEVLRLVTEPTAAALAYGLDRFGVGSVMVFDLGGGTLDVSVLELTPGRIEVRAVAGDVALGGDDFDTALVEWMLRTVEATHGVDVSSDLMAVQRLRDAAEQAKIELSAVTSTKVTLPFLTVSDGTPVHFDVTVTRDRFDTLTSPLVARIAGPVRRVMEDLSVTGRALDHVVLVGGGSRVPAVRAALSKLLGGRRLNALVNPEEAVALGAALQAGLLTGEVKDVLLLEVTPLALGVETKGGLTFPLISRNTTIPVSRTDLFTTDVDGQTEVTVRVLQGERPLAADNRVLGEFRLSGIPPAPRGAAQIAVAFDIDADGILKVTANDLAGGVSRQLLITGGSALPDDEVERMVADAQMYAAADDRVRSEVLVRNQADSLLYDLARVLSLYAEVLPESVVGEAGRAEQSMRIALSTNDVALIDRRRGELQTCYQTVLQQARALLPQLASDDVVDDVEVLPSLL